MVRDYHSEMMAVVAGLEPSGSTSRVLAAGLVARLEAEDPGLLTGWMRLHVESHLARFIGDFYRSQRDSVSAVSVFSEAARVLAEEGDEGPLRSLMDLVYVVDREKTRKRLGDMTRLDHRFVAGEHRKLATSSLFEEAYHLAIAKRLRGGQKTSERFTDEQLVAIRERLRLGE